ncbi:abortive infection system antitoxin AbiGi family protein [Halovulum marinum]|nr:abortive infection system antitoxin AbiGi family protein [Halovulum marinum]
MTEEDARTYFVGSKKVTIPPSPQCCFTELKLSEARRHAARYGRLGIGVKRPFLFNRFGRPMIYFGFDASATNDKFLSACLADITEKSLLNYFKPMNSNIKMLNYDFYSESEWRIILFNELIDKGYIKDPSDHRNKKEFEYYKGLSDQEKSKLKYLLPLDHWFSLIIYPSVDVKVMCQEGNGEYISNQIKRIKSERGASGSTLGGGWPIELDLDACRNF